MGRVGFGGRGRANRGFEMFFISKGVLCISAQGTERGSKI